MSEGRRQWHLLVPLFILHPSPFVFPKKEGERMHRTTPWAWSLLGALVALMAGGAVVPTRLAAQTCSPEPRQLVVLLNGTVRLQMLTKKRIRAVTNPKEGVLTIRTIEGDPTSIILVGVGAGITRLELEDVDGGKEVREVVVQADVEHLNAQLRRAVPLANITVTPVGNASVALSGYVQRAEDISVAAAIAQSSGFSVINGLRLNGVQQVQLDVVIAQVRRTKGRNFGFNFLQNSRRQILGSTIGNLIQGAPTTAVGVPSGVLQPATFGQVINSIPAQANLFGGVISNNDGFLGFLQALETEGLAKILSQPRLAALSGQPASFLVGGEQAVPVPAGLGQVGVQFEEFGTRLNFLPVVLGNGRIHLEVEPEVSTLDPNAGVAIAGATVAGRATQRIHTTVELETGQTFVIGGLIQKITTGTTNKVPWLGQLPFIGAAFSTKTHTDDETELVVMVTPHLVDAQSADQLVKVLPGQETRTPDDFELFLEGILEAPRGPRPVFVNGRYIPAHRVGPTADLFPCAGSGDCGGKGVYPLTSGNHGGHGGNCGKSGCVTPLQPQPAPQPINGVTNGAGPTARPTVSAPAVQQTQTQTSSGEPPVVEPDGGSLSAATPGFEKEIEPSSVKPATQAPAQQPPVIRTTGGEQP
jgi:pilus assembly protein CpaC